MSASTCKAKPGLLVALAQPAHRPAAHNHLLEVGVPRKQGFANKYAEAEVLVERYPELAPWKPEKRRFYDNEPRNTVLFEALSLALTMQGQG